jgi:hypothetical protein
MTFSYHDLLSPQDILADVLVDVNDEEMKTFRIGWYMRQIRSATEKLNYQAPFRETFIDLPISDDLTIEIPKGVWNIKDIFLWSGDNCVISQSTRVFHKDNFYTHGSGQGYTARNKTGQADYYIRPRTNDAAVYFYNTHNGCIHLSEACKTHGNIRIVYNGMPKDISETKFIPPFCRQAVCGYVVERVYSAMKGRDLAYRTLWHDAERDLYLPKGTEPSKWDYAIMMIKRLDTKYYDDLSEYLSKMNY